MRCLSFSLVAIGTLALGHADNAVPPILDPAPYTTWSETSSDGLSKKAVLSVPFTNSSGDADFVLLKRLDLVGNATQRGRAQVRALV